MEFGPVDILVLKTTRPDFGINPQFDSRMLAELEKAVSSGAIRVLDAMVLSMDEGGSVQGADIEDLPNDQKLKLGFVETGTRGMFHSDDASIFSDQLEPGAAIGVLAIEHAWASQLRATFSQAGFEKISATRVPESVVNERFATLPA